MDIQIHTDAEAWNFLVDVVKPNGEFRIHTNKKGIRLHIDFKCRKYTGYYKKYKVWYNRLSSFDKYIHRDAFEVLDRPHYDSIVCDTLCECAKSHIRKLLGDALDPDSEFDNYISHWKCKEFNGTKEEFLKLL